MSEPGVASERITDCTVVYEPVGKENTGLAAGTGDLLLTTLTLSEMLSCTCLPQHFTWTTCAPGSADMVALKDVETNVVGPESREYPMLTAGRDAHVLVLAISLNGEVTCVPDVGVVTVIADA